MPRGRAANYADQQDSILQHAALLFAAQGFQGTSMLELARAAGVSKALLYHYYEDKYQLLVAIAEGHIDRLKALVDRVIAQGAPPGERLPELIRCIVEEYADAHCHHQVLVQDLKYLDEKDQRRIHSKERKVVAAFAAAIAEAHPGLATAQLEKALTMLIFGMINWLFTWFSDDGPLDYPQMAQLVTQFVTGGLREVAASRAG